MDKEANPGGWRRLFSDPAVAAPLIGMVAAPLVGAGVSALATHKARMDAAKQKTVAYRGMLELHPHLKTRDTKEVALIFNSLHNANPQMARDPLVSGAWVDNIIESKRELGSVSSNQALLGAVKDLAGIRASMSQALKNESRPGAVGDRFERVVGELGGGIGKAYDHANKHGLAVATEKLEEREAKAHELSLGLQRAAQELSEKEDHLTNLAQQLAAFKHDVGGGHKTASDQDLERMFAELGI